MARAPAIELCCVLDQVSVLTTERKHYSVKLLEAQLAGIHLIKAAIEQVDVVVREVHEAETLLQALFKV